MTTKRLIFYFLVLCFASISCQNRPEDHIHILQPGIGYGNFIIDSTKLTDIVLDYGPRYMIDTTYWKAPFDTTQIFCINYTYDTLGVSFSFYPDSKSFFCITLKSPFRGKTDKEIILGESTFNEIIRAYGETKWSYVGDMKTDPIFVGKHYEGINFFQDFSEGMFIEDSVIAKYLNNKVTRIEIIKK